MLLILPEVGIENRSPATKMVKMVKMEGMERQRVFFDRRVIHLHEDGLRNRDHVGLTVTFSDSIIEYSTG